LWLRRADQATVAALTTLALLAMLLHWYWRGGHAGRLIEVDRVEPGAVAYTVDVNAADWQEFTVLPGVGETLARRIVEFREEHGPFRDLRDLREVRGIGPRTLERLTPYLRPIPSAEATAEVGAPREDS
jgi:competence protein ComEA